MTPLEVFAAHQLNHEYGLCTGCDWDSARLDWDTDVCAAHAAHVLDALTNAGHEVVQAVSTEERWVPVTESGERWEPRSREEADEAMQNWPAGGVYENSGEPYDGITHILHERRVATDWESVAAAVEVVRRTAGGKA